MSMLVLVVMLEGRFVPLKIGYPSVIRTYSSLTRPFSENTK